MIKYLRFPISENRVFLLSPRVKRIGNKEGESSVPVSEKLTPCEDPFNEDKYKSNCK